MDSVSQFEISSGVFVALKIQIKATQRSEEFNQIPGSQRWKCSRKVGGLFEQRCSIGLDRPSTQSRLTGEFRFNFGSNLNSDYHGCARSSTSNRMRSQPAP